MKSALWVGLGGFSGAILRYFITAWVGNALVATFSINVLGCFLIGFTTAWLATMFPSYQAIRLLLITGFLGGFTTFSTYGMDSFKLLKDGVNVTALFYIVAQVVVGILMVYGGDALFKKFC